MKKIFVLMMVLCCAACTKVEQVEQKTLDENEVYWWMQETEVKAPSAEAFPKDAVIAETK